MNAVLSPQQPGNSSSTSTHTRLRGNPLWAARAAWFVIVGAAVVLLFYALPIQYNNLRTDSEILKSLANTGISPEFHAAFHVGLSILYLATFVDTGIVIFWRRSDDWMAIFTSIMLVTFGGFVSSEMPNLLMSQPEPFPHMVLLMALIGNTLFITFLYINPDGQFVPRWTRSMVVALAIWSVLSMIFPQAPFSPAAMPPSVAFPFFLGLYGSGAIAQLYRERHYYTQTQRQQVKWITLGLTIALIGFFVSYIPAVLVSVADESPLVQILSDTVGGFISYVLVMAIPISIAFSILRYRLWDVDIVLTRGLVYGAITILLVLVFAAAFLGLQFIVPSMSEGQHAPIALAVSALVIGGSFQPVRRRLQSLVDRRLYGIQVEYRSKPVEPRGMRTDLVGSKLGPYEVLEPLGRGGMAEVYKGLHPTLGRTVALKLLPADLAKDQEFRHRFEREARMVAALKHPNIIQVFDCGEQDGLYYMVMEYIEGKVLEDVMRAMGPMPLSQARPIIAELAGALDYAHEQGIIHRDIKPSNVMLEPITATAGRGERAVLMDFGIARMVGGATKITSTGLIGTFDYMAPEQIRDAKEVDGRADIYSLGVMAFQILTGKLPFTASNPGALLIAHMQQPPPDPRSLCPDLSEEIAAAILRALEKDPANRFATAGTMLEAMI
jgi:predicted Ser/Thr protein kinase